MLVIFKNFNRKQQKNLSFVNKRASRRPFFFCDFSKKNLLKRTNSLKTLTSMLQYYALVEILAGFFKKNAILKL